ncbi:Ribonuclease P protein component [hydrothermal vent metagenome]|uniref:Ribonuclease P protein component n=1 Tax=hydrothermal vent metagenome TaxID=652676 RepID=A0A3B0S427_9ZZZZ
MAFVLAKPPLEAAKYWLRAVLVAAQNFLPETEIAFRPEAVVTGSTKNPQTIEVIRKRPDFLRANRGKRFVTPGFVLLAHKRSESCPVPLESIRYGITVTKKVGNAIARNRMKRRFRAMLSEILPQCGMKGVDHIIIGRKQCPEPEFAAMKTELEKGLKHLARKL